MNHYRKHQGTPAYHSTSALNGHPATYRVTRAMRTPAEIERENQERAFKNGFLLGFALAALIACAVLWFWVIPTMDGAVQQAQQAVSYTAVAA